MAFFETVVVAWVYGRERFYNDLFFMFGHKMDVRKGFMASFGYMWQVGDHFQINFEKFFVTFNPETPLGVSHVSLEVIFFSM